MTTLQWVAAAFGLALITLLLGLAIFVAFQREDRRQERLRRDAMRGHPSTRDPWNDQDGPL